MGGRRIDIVNVGGLLAALVSAAAIAWWMTARIPDSVAVVTAAPVRITEMMPDGVPAVRGGDGELVRVADYRRIASLVPEVDDALAAMGMTDRLAAVGAYSRAHSVYARHLTRVPGTIAGGSGVEEVLAFKPDLVVVSAFSDPGRTQRMRDAGVPVFNLGQERGAEDAAMAVRRIAALCGEATRGDQLAARFLSRLHRVADPRLPRSRACYVECVGTQLFLASVGTNQSDILVAAGFEDAAGTARYRSYGECRIEDLLRIAPEVMVVPTGSAAIISGMSGSAGIPAVAHRRIIEVDADLLSSPGIAMLDATEVVATAREHVP